MSTDPDEDEGALMAAVCGAATASWVDVLLTGVEHPRQLDLAREAGVTFAQGHVAGPPVPPGPLPPQPEALPRAGRPGT